MTMSSCLYGFLLFDGFSNMVLASAVEPLRAARELAGPESFNWRLLTLDGATTTSCSGLEIRPHASLAATEQLDTLFVMCGHGARRFATPAVLKPIKRAVRSIPTVGGLNMGAWLLAAAGLLDGRRATIHWQELDACQEAFPKVRVQTDRFVIDGPRITAGGATTVLELMIHLIRERGGKALAFDVSNMFVYDVEHALRQNRGSINHSLAARAPQLIKAIGKMRRSVADPLPLSRIASLTACSSRTLQRLFVRELGMPAGRYYQLIRLRSARTLAEETALSVTSIAARTGFASSATLARAFGECFGMSIRDLRRSRRM